VLDATLARILLLLVWTLATALLSALMSRVLLLLTRLLLSTMLLGALATLLVLLSGLPILALAHAAAPLQRSLGRNYLRQSSSLLITKYFAFRIRLPNIRAFLRIAGRYLAHIAMNVLI